MGQHKIGARILNIEEIKLILPTFEKLLEQLDEIQSNNDSSKDDLDNMQKTNNIAILGERGSGKTSVLKTIFKELNERSFDNNKKKYIVLPIIVPENMSDSSNLISTILGLFKGELERIKKLHEQNNECGMGNKLTSVELEYSKLLKRFCYIQKEFRDVLVSEFTTENDYVKKSSEIFMSDIEFINAFNSFINSLVKDDSYESNPLIVFFIDDIDLSTARCTDIVKTLLSYISHKNIVTFISGDLNTFEEALTIDFLRQENVLNRSLFKCSFLKNGGNLLERKKLLAYEYLKKIIPPLYRHNIKKWSLADRGNYCIKEDESEAIKMMDLLTVTLSQFIDKSYFKYISFNGNEEKEMPIPQMFNIFDNTSRGLNNIYNVLLDTKEILTQQDSKQNQTNKFIAIKLLLETIVASNSTLSGYRNELLGKVINFGVDFQTTVIRVDNFQSLLFNGINYEWGLTVTEFSLFVFLDLSIRLLKQTSILDDTAYKNTRMLAICSLINTPQISDSSVVIGNPILKRVPSKNNSNADQPKLVTPIIDQNLGSITFVDAVSKSTTQKSIVNVLHNSNFPYSITMYQYLSRNGYNIFENYTDLEYIADVYNVYLSTATIDEKDIIDVVSKDAILYENFFRGFNDIISPDELPNTVRNIFKNIFRDPIPSKKSEKSIRDIFKKKFSDSTSSHTELEINNFKYGLFKDLIINLFVCKMRDELFINNRLVPLATYHQVYLTLGRYTNSPKEVEVLLIIDKKGLWKNDQVKKTEIYIREQILNLLDALVSNHNNIEIGSLKDSYDKFMFNTYKGVTYTKAASLASVLRGIIPNYQFGDNNTYLTLDVFADVKKEVRNLAYNERAWYGQPEARNMLYALDQARFSFFEDNDLDCEISDYRELLMWMHFYAAYFAYNNNMEDVYLQSGKLAKFSDVIRQGENKGEADNIKSFMDILNDGNNHKIEIDEFNKLF